MAGDARKLRPKRIILADEQTLVLEALSCLLSRNVDIIEVANDGLELVRLARLLRPDVVLSRPGVRVKGQSCDSVPLL